MKHSFDDKVEDIKRNLEINEKAQVYILFKFVGWSMKER